MSRACSPTALLLLPHPLLGLSKLRRLPGSWGPCFPRCTGQRAGSCMKKFRGEEGAEDAAAHPRAGLPRPGRGRGKEASSVLRQVPGAPRSLTVSAGVPRPHPLSKAHPLHPPPAAPFPRLSERGSRDNSGHLPRDHQGNSGASRLPEPRPAPGSSAASAEPRVRASQVGARIRPHPRPRPPRPAALTRGRSGAVSPSSRRGQRAGRRAPGVQAPLRLPGAPPLRLRSARPLPRAPQ